MALNKDIIVDIQCLHVLVCHRHELILRIQAITETPILDGLDIDLSRVLVALEQSFGFQLEEVTEDRGAQERAVALAVRVLADVALARRLFDVLLDHVEEIDEFDLLEVLAAAFCRRHEAVHAARNFDLLAIEEEEEFAFADLIVELVRGPDLYFRRFRERREGARDR